MAENTKKAKEEVGSVDLESEEKAKKKERKKTTIQAIKYALFTASAGIIQFASFTIMTYAFRGQNWGNSGFFDMPTTDFIATTVALALSVLWNFTINRKYTFKSAGNVPRAMGLAFLFYVPFYPFQTWYVGTVAELLGGFEWSKLIAEGTVMLINGVLEFCWQKFVIYGKEEQQAAERQKCKEIGENGEIHVMKQNFTGEELHELMSAGIDINATSDKKLRKWLDKHNK